MKRSSIVLSLPGELDEVTLTELIKQPDVRAVIDMLATWGMVYAKPLTERFGEFI